MTEDISIDCVLFLRKTMNGKTLIIGVVDESITDHSDAFGSAHIVIDKVWESTATHGTSYPVIVQKFGKFLRDAVTGRTENGME